MSFIHFLTNLAHKEIGLVLVAEQAILNRDF